MFEPFQNSKGQIGLITKFLGELHLSDIVDSSEQYDLCTKIVEKVPEEKNYFPPAKIVPEYLSSAQNYLSCFTQNLCLFVNA